MAVMYHIGCTNRMIPNFFTFPVNSLMCNNYVNGDNGARPMLRPVRPPPPPNPDRLETALGNARDWRPSASNGPYAGLSKLHQKSKLGRKRCDCSENGTSEIVLTCFYI